MSETKKKPRLSWRKEPRPKGLAAVGHGPLGMDLRIGEERVASVRPKYKGWGRQIEGWYWVAYSDAHGIPTQNTSYAPAPTMEAAQAQAAEYVKAYRKEPS